MFKMISESISNKIIVSLFLLMTISSVTIIINTMIKVKKDSIQTTQESLEMLNDAIFLSLRNAMNTGDIEQIQKAEHDASKIKWVKNLRVAKGQKLI